MYLYSHNIAYDFTPACMAQMAAANHPIPTIGNDSVHHHEGRRRDDHPLGHGQLTKIAIEMTLAAAAIVTHVATSNQGQGNALWVKISISAMLISLSASLASALLSSVYLRAIRVLGHVAMLFSVLAVTSLISVAVLGKFRWFSSLPCLVPLASLSKELFFNIKSTKTPQPVADASSFSSQLPMSISAMNGEALQPADGGLDAGSPSAAFQMDAALPSSTLSTSQCNVPSTSSAQAVSNINPHMSDRTCKAAARDQSAHDKHAGAEELITIVVETTN